MFLTPLMSSWRNEKSVVKAFQNNFSSVKVSAFENRPFQILAFPAFVTDDPLTPSSPNTKKVYQWGSESCENLKLSEERMVQGRKHTVCHRKAFVVKSQLPRENADLRHPLKTAYSAGTPHILERFTTNLELRRHRLIFVPCEDASQRTKIIQ